MERKTQTSLQSGKSFDEAAKDGFKAGLLGAAAAGAGNLAGGLLGKQFGKVVDKYCHVGFLRRAYRKLKGVAKKILLPTKK